MNFIFWIHRLKKETKWITYEETITKNTTIVKRLTKNEEYSFRVSAVNEIGTSEYSMQSEFIKVSFVLIIFRLSCFNHNK